QVQLRYSPDGRWLFAHCNQTIRVRDQETKKATEILKAPIRDWAPAPDGKTVAVSTNEGKVIILEPTGKIRAEWQFPGPINRLAYSQDGQRIATANPNGSVYLLRVP